MVSCVPDYSCPLLLQIVKRVLIGSISKGNLNLWHGETILKTDLGRRRKNGSEACPSQHVLRFEPGNEAGINLYCHGEANFNLEYDVLL